MSSNQSQNKVFTVGFVLIVLVVVWFLARPAVLKLFEKGDKSEEQINAEILKAPSISAQDLFKKIGNKENVIVADLRSAEEFGKGHIIASRRYGADELSARNAETLKLGKTADLVIVNSGDAVYETAKKTNELVAAGFVNVKYLAGGIDGWRNEGYALITGGLAQADQNKVKKISLDDLVSNLSAGADTVQFLDMRNGNDFGTGHIPGAVNILPADLEKNQDKFSSVKKIVVYGSSEQEASQAAATLFDLNFFNVYVLDGGLDAWKAAGGKVE